MKIKNKWLRLALLVLVLALLAFSYWQKADAPAPSEPAALTLVTDAPAGEEASLDEDGSYTSAADVALYLHAYGRLPANFITKAEAEQAGWPGGSLEKYCPGKCIGGDRFGNREGLLPDGDYIECDLNTLGADERGAERLVFTEEGEYYHTEDHYASFTQVWVENGEVVW